MAMTLGTINAGHLPRDDRALLREVALAFRRSYRSAQAEGLKPPDFYMQAVRAAEAEYRRHRPDAPPEPLAISGRVNAMIAAAINADPQWFWNGPDK